MPRFFWSITMYDTVIPHDSEILTGHGDLTGDEAGIVSQEHDPCSIALTDFVSEFGDELLDALNTANPPVYTGAAQAHRQAVLENLKRKLFPAQAEVAHAVTELLLHRNERAAIVNGEMGSGKVRRIGD